MNPDFKKMVGMIVLVVLFISACSPQGDLPGGGQLTPVTPNGEPAGEKNLLISDLSREVDSPVAADDLQRLVRGNSEFAVDLYRFLTRDEQGNQFYSPYSISLALAMTYAGARGETERQMAEALHFDLPQERLHAAFNRLDQSLTGSSQAGEEASFRLNIANSLWGQQDYPFLQSFLDTLARNYGAGMYIVDYNQPDHAADLINQWVAEQTEDKIRDLIPRGSLNPLTKLVLANAIYFNGNWTFPFEEGATRPGEFHLLDGRTIEVPMMNLGENLFYLKGEGFQALQLPYQDSSMALLVFLADEGEFYAFEERLDAALIQGAISALQMTQVELSMPKFKIESKFSLNNALKELGMPDAFAAERADFTGMSEVRELFITDVVHKAYVDVNEKGTEAAAATGVVVGVESMPAEQVEFKIDRPFVFLIVDRSSDTILFVGRVIDPR